MRITQSYPVRVRWASTLSDATLIGLSFQNTPSRQTFSCTTYSMKSFWTDVVPARNAGRAV